MGLRFIFMLTRNDRTVQDAMQQLKTAQSLGIRHIGFKDIGLSLDQLKLLNTAIQRGGATSYLEVVSLDRDSERVSAKAAVDIGVNVLLGGTHVDDILPIIAGTSIQYFPFPGKISGHPSVLEGSVDDIVASAQAIAAREGVHGLDLLAYRSKEDVPTLMRAVCAAVSKPVIMAGSIDTPERIALVKHAGAMGFTIGTAALDGKYPAEGQDVPSQLGAIVRDVAALNAHLSPFHKKSLTLTVRGLDAPGGGAGIVMQTSNMQVLVAKFDDAPSWTFRRHGDGLFFVHEGRLLLRFRDRDEIIEQGDYIVIPRGVEYCPVVLNVPCGVMIVRSEPVASEVR